MNQSDERQKNLLLDDLTALEEYVHDLFSFSPLPICFISPAGVVLEVNPAFEKISGYEMDKIVGESVNKLFKKEEIESLSKETFRSGSVNGRELIFLRQDNQSIATQVFSKMRRDERGEAVGYFLSFFDLTDIKKTESELKRIQLALLNILEDTEEARRRSEQERNKTQTIITNFADGLFFFDSDHRLAMINPRAEFFFQVRSANVVNRSVQELQRLASLQKTIDFIGPEMKEFFRRELALSENLILEVSVIPMRHQGANAGDLVVFHDITREKRVERLKTEFVSLSAHQLRTPLSAIKWSLKMLLDGDLGKLSKDQIEIVKKTYQSNERMIDLINDLLNVTRIEEGRYVFNPTSVDLIKLAQTVIALLEPNFKAKNLRFVFCRPRKKLPLVFGDQEKIGLALQNLLDNSLKYTPSGGRVELSFKEEQNEILVEVKDTGIGIGQEEQSRVFTKFFRAPEAVLTEPAGTGLGLYMVKNIIEAHGGRIWFESEPGKETRFYFALPINNNIIKQ